MRRKQKAGALLKRRRFQVERLENRRLLAFDFSSPFLFEGHEAVPNELLVQYASRSTANEGNPRLMPIEFAVAETIQTKAMQASGSGVIQRVTLGEGIDMKTAIEQFRRNPDVLYVGPNYIYRTNAVSNDPFYTNGSLWGMYSNDGAITPTVPLNQFGSQAERVWNDNDTTGSPDVVVGVIDSGIDINHPDLQDNIWKNPGEIPGDMIDNDGNGFTDDINGWDFLNNNSSVYDLPTLDYHGTHVAGTIGARGGNGIGVAGVAWNVKMISLKIAEEGRPATSSNAIKAIDYTTDMKKRGINIVATNNSWGGTPYDQPLHEAILRNAKQNILFVASAGNDGSNNDVNQYYPASYDTMVGTDDEPAAEYDSVISVAAINSTGGLYASSNFGATSVDLAAPGVDIWSTYPGNSYQPAVGTSQAAAHVTGAVALFASTKPTDFPAELIRGAILQSAASTPSLTGITATGGRLDIYQATQEAVITSRLSASAATTEKGGEISFLVALRQRPAFDVEIPIRSSDTTEGTIGAVSSLFFRPADWGPQKVDWQKVTVTGLDDFVDDGDIPYRIILDALKTRDPYYDRRDPSDINLANIDDDTAGITVSAAPGMTTTEAPGLGNTVTFTVRLNSEPTANVTIPISSTDITEGVVSTSSLVFTPVNWNSTQTVTITGVNDAIDDGNIPYTVILGAATSTDGNYNGTNPADIELTNLDDDTFGITVSPPSGPETTEAGGAVTFTVRLNSEPTANVTIPISSTDITEGVVSTSSLVFTPVNWNSTQTVTITGVNDAVDDGNIPYMVSLGAATSTDGNYNGTNPADIELTNLDDDTFGITVSSPSGKTTTEAGGTVTFTVRLTSEPIANVTIPVSSSNINEGRVSTASLVFTATDWSTPKTVTVTGVNDDIDDGDIAFQVLFGPVASTDPLYAGVSLSPIKLSNLDDDTRGVTVSPPSGPETTEAGGRITFTVRLNSQPTANVTIPIRSSDTTEGTVSPSSLVFTAANWNTPSTVTVTGVNDDIDDGDIDYTVILDPAVSTDTNYGGFNPIDVNTRNRDDDTAGFTVTPSGPRTTEAGGTVTITVRLNSEPTGDVILPVRSTDTTEGTASTSSLIFNRTNWRGQTVTVAGVDDFVDDGDIAYRIEILPDTISTDLNYRGRDPNDVNLINQDNDTVGVRVTPTLGLTTTEAGGTASFSVRLNSEPLSDVLVPISSSDTTEGTTSTHLLTFSPANWDFEQTVIVTGVDDTIYDGNIFYTIFVRPTVASDPLYNGIDPSDVSATNIDDDTAPSKFFVINDGEDRNFRYDGGGNLTTSTALTAANTAPRGMATNSLGTRVWIVDSNRTVYVYENNGTLVGSWAAGGMPSNAVVEGIASNGTHIWILDNGSDRVYYYPNAAARFSGTQNATSNFLLNGANRNPKDIVTDGSSIWVVNDTTSDRVFRYSMSGVLQTSWAISTENASPTGIAIDPSNKSSDIWIVDNGTDRVYRYASARILTAPMMASSFPLALANTNPQGLINSPAGPWFVPFDVSISAAPSAMKQTTATVQGDPVLSQATREALTYGAASATGNANSAPSQTAIQSTNGGAKSSTTKQSSTKPSSLSVRDQVFADLGSDSL